MTAHDTRVVREIMVATDFSEASAAAVRVAHAYARTFGARLHVVHVTWPEAARPCTTRRGLNEVNAPRLPHRRPTERGRKYSEPCSLDPGMVNAVCRP